MPSLLSIPYTHICWLMIFNNIIVRLCRINEMATHIGEWTYVCKLEHHSPLFFIISGTYYIHRIISLHESWHQLVFQKKALSIIRRVPPLVTQHFVIFSTYLRVTLKNRWVWQRTTIDFQSFRNFLLILTRLMDPFSVETISSPPIRWYLLAPEV